MTETINCEKEMSIRLCRKVEYKFDDRIITNRKTICKTLNMSLMMLIVTTYKVYFRKIQSSSKLLVEVCINIVLV